MARLIFLGTSNALPEAGHENTHMALVGEERLVLIDCVGSPELRLAPLGIDLTHRLSDLIVTHFHPDHASGVPSLVMGSWLRGRTARLPIYALPHALERVQKNLDLYGWQDWPRFYGLDWHTIPEDELTLVLDCPDFRLLASPVCHMIPAAGLRIELPNGRVLAYSCDTAPCEAVVRLAQGADILIHEATNPLPGAFPGHTSPAEAGEIATRAGVKALYLIHYDAGQAAALLAAAQAHFDGPVVLAEDMMAIEV